MASERYRVTHEDGEFHVLDGNAWFASFLTLDKAKRVAAALNTAAGVAELVDALRECDKELKDIVGWHREETTPLREIELRHIEGVRERAAEVLAKWEDGK